MKQLKLAALVLYITGHVFGLLETWYFGWNMFPMSNSELVCDTIAGTITTIGILLIFYYLQVKTNEEIKLKIHIVHNPRSNEK